VPAAVAAGGLLFGLYRWRTRRTLRQSEEDSGS